MDNAYIYIYSRRISTLLTMPAPSRAISSSMSCLSASTILEVWEQARAGVSGVYELVVPTATHLLAVAVSRLAAVSEEWLEVAQRCDGWIPQPPNDSSSRVVAEEEDV
jgi:hypothetical protein